MVGGRCALCLLVAGACSFRPEGIGPAPDGREHLADGTPPPPIDAAPPVDASPPDAAPVCGDGVLEAGEACEVGDVLACASPCGEEGTETCTDACTPGPCRVELAATNTWTVATSAGGSYAPVDLPHTNWGCTTCARHYAATVCDRPSAVTFRWASDNRARLFVNGTTAFDDYWLSGYCTDAPCCTKCCDSTANCISRLSASYALDPAALALFGAGSNHLRWEVEQEIGGSGFYVLTTVEY